MARKKVPKKKAPESEANVHQIKGYHVQILKVGDVEHLMIDDKEQKFLKSDDGYQVGFAPVAKTLLDAAKSYLALFPDKK